MKKIFLLILLPALLITTSCNKQKAEIERLKAKNDSLMAVGFAKDTTVMSYVRAFNEIQSNLDSIKQKENIISQNTQGGTELQADAKDQVTSDINAIYLLLQKNRAIVEQLRSKLKKSDVRIVELEKMIEALNTQINEKDTEIASLKDQLAKLNIKVEGLSSEVSSLNKTVDNLSSDNRSKQQTIDSKTAELNTAFYVIGSSKELKEKNIITKEGGFIGLGKSKTVKSDFDKSYFTKVDITKFKGMPIFKKKATLLTTHPAGSFKLTGVKAVDSLVIKNYSEFWSASKYLVVIAE
jgi:chromosome segregation ATPase